MKKVKRFTITSLVYFFGNTLSKVINIILLPIITSIINPSDYGQYDVTLTIISLIVPIAFFQIWDGVFRFSFDEKKIGKIKIIFNGYMFAILGSVIFLIMYLVISIFYLEFRNLYILIYSLMIAYQYIFTVNARVYLNNSLFVLSGIFNTLVTAILTILLLLYSELDINSLYISGALGILIQIIIIESKMKTFKMLAIEDFDAVLIKKMIKFSIPLFLSSIVYWGLNGFTRVFILYEIGQTGNGYFAIANKFSSIVLLISGVFQFAWNEMIYLDVNSKDRFKNYTKGIKIAFMISILAASFMILLIKLLFPLIIDIEYSPAIYLIPPVIMGVTFNSFASLLGTIFMAEKKSSTMLYTALVSSLLNIIFALVLTTYFGIFGIAFALTIAMLVNACLRIILLKRITMVKISFEFLFVLIIMSLSIFLYYKMSTTLEITLSILLIVILSILVSKNILIDLYRSLKHRGGSN